MSALGRSHCILSDLSCKWLIRLFKFLPQNIQIKGQCPNWDSINAFITVLRRSWFRMLQTLAKVLTFCPAFLHCFTICSSNLTLRLRNTWIYVFQALFGFCNFKAISCGFWKLGVSSLHSTLNFEWIERDFWRLYVLVCCCAVNQYSEIIGVFSEDFKPKSAF